MQLVAKSRGQQSRRDGEDTDTQQGHDHRHEATYGGDGGDITIAHRRQCDDRPINRVGDVVKLLGLCFVFNHITQAGGHDHHQNHDEGGRADDRPFAGNHGGQNFGGIVVARQLE